MKAKPFLRWTGGKTRLIPELVKRVPQQFGDYIEPFLGGGALFFELADRIRTSGGAAYLADTNRALIDAYRGVQESVNDVILHLRAFAKEHSAEQYSRIRSLPSEHHLLAVRAARFIYLNKTCFNGLWRVNKKGQFNVPWDPSKTSESIVDVDNLKACSEALQGVQLLDSDFRSTMQIAGEGDLIYCDPPYIPISATSNFVGYTTGGFTDRDQVDLMAQALRAKFRGANVLLSQSSAPVVKEIYSGFKIEEVWTKRSVSADPASRGPCAEVLIS